MVQRVRIYYFKKDPPNTKRISRPGKYGNKYSLKDYSLEESLRLYELDLIKTLEENPEFLEPLRHVNKGCFCKLDAKCHGDIIQKYLDKKIEIIDKIKNTTLLTNRDIEVFINDHNGETIIINEYLKDGMILNGIVIEKDLSVAVYMKKKRWYHEKEKSKQICLNFKKKLKI